jgi:hypothetical protein
MYANRPDIAKRWDKEGENRIVGKRKKGKRKKGGRR